MGVEGGKGKREPTSSDFHDVRHDPSANRHLCADVDQDPDRQQMDDGRLEDLPERRWRRVECRVVRCGRGRDVILVLSEERLFAPKSEDVGENGERLVGAKRAIVSERAILRGRGEEQLTNNASPNEHK